jgi:nitroimidazol reductase NimA-like FMN-containing flavoprotein (pyridoxamine 5'-phosphate oxidase superfamily)
MRRVERAIAGNAEKLALIEGCKVCRLGLSLADEPYIVPLNYGYAFEGGRLTLYFHGASEGKKIDIIRRNSRACFEIDCEHKLLEAETACAHSFAFASLVGFGRIEFIADNEEKTRALNILMKHQTGKDIQHIYDEAMLSRVCVFKMIVDEFTGKRKAP